jgi:hypothetical protein
VNRSLDRHTEVYEAGHAVAAIDHGVTSTRVLSTDADE